MCYLFCSLFQAHSVFHYVVMGANVRRCSRTQNEIIASKTELPVKKLNSAFLRNSVILITLSGYSTLRKGIPHLRDSVKYLILSALHYLVISFTVSAWSGTRSLPRALEAERNQVRS